MRAVPPSCTSSPTCQPSINAPGARSIGALPAVRTFRVSFMTGAHARSYAEFDAVGQRLGQRGVPNARGGSAGVVRDAKEREALLRIVEQRVRRSGIAI